MKKINRVIGCVVLVLASCSVHCRADRHPDPAPEVERARPRFDPLSTSAHLHDAHQALRALPEDVTPDRRANLHISFATTLHLLEQPELAPSYLEQVRRSDPMIAPLLDPLEAELDAIMPGVRERFREAPGLDIRRLIVARQLEPIQHVDPVVSSLLDVSLSYEELSQLTGSRSEALFLLEDQTRRTLLKAEHAALQGDTPQALAILEQIDEEVFSHHVLGMDRWLRTKWVEIAARQGARDLIATSMQRELPLYFDEQTPALERARGLLLGCQLLLHATLYEDAMRYCDAGKKLLQKKGSQRHWSQSKYLSDQREIDLLAAAGYEAALGLKRFEDAHDFVSLHDDAVWRATRHFDLFESQVFELLRAKENARETSPLYAQAQALMRLAHDRLGFEEQLIAALLVLAHDKEAEDHQDRLDALLSKMESREALFALSTGATLTLQIRQQALLLAVAREVKFKHDALTFKAMEHAHELQKDELPDQPDYFNMIVELELLDVAQHARESDFSSAAQISNETLRMVDILVTTDGNRGLELDVPDIATRLQRAPTLILAWLGRLKRVGHMVAFLNQFQRGGVEILAHIPSSKVEELLHIVRWLEVRDEQARVVLVEHLLEQLGHEPEVRAYAGEQVWRALSFREVPLDRALSLYDKWLEVQMDSGVSVVELMKQTSEETVDEEARRRANLKLLNRLFGAQWLSPEVNREALTRLERQVVLSAGGRYVVERAKLGALRARTGDCDAVARLDAKLFDAFPPALPSVVRWCRDEVDSGALHAWLMTRTDEEARAVRELVFELLYARSMKP